jgi:hypothetical protein
MPDGKADLKMFSILSLFHIPTPLAIWIFFILVRTLNKRHPLCNNEISEVRYNNYCWTTHEYVKLQTLKAMACLCLYFPPMSFPWFHSLYVGIHCLCSVFGLKHYRRDANYKTSSTLRDFVKWRAGLGVEHVT